MAHHGQGDFRDLAWGDKWQTVQGRTTGRCKGRHGDKPSSWGTRRSPPTLARPHSQGAPRPRHPGPTARHRPLPPMFLQGTLASYQLKGPSRGGGSGLLRCRHPITTQRSGPPHVLLHPASPCSGTETWVGFSLDHQQRVSEPGPDKELLGSSTCSRAPALSALPHLRPQRQSTLLTRQSDPRVTPATGGQCADQLILWTWAMPSPSGSRKPAPPQGKPVPPLSPAAAHSVTNPHTASRSLALTQRRLQNQACPSSH